MSGSAPADRIVGRQDDLAWIGSFLGAVPTSGGSVLLSGDPGIGKSALLDEAAAEARLRGLAVLRAEGVEFESDVSYAALHQLVRPVLPELDGVDRLFHEALTVALRLRSGADPAPLAVVNGALALLGRVAGGSGLVPVVDDVQWVDRASAAALGMIARRTSGTRIGLLLAARSGHSTLLSSVVAEERTVGPLPAAAARGLVRREHPGLTPLARERLVAVSGGNPLALIELGAELGAYPDATETSGPTLPLTRRLRLLYAERLRRLPGTTRVLLLAAALEPAADGPVLRSVGAVGAAGLDVPAALDPAVRDGLVDLGRAGRDQGGTVRFAHPLIRSAVVALAELDERARCHRSLAEALVDDPVRRAWHLGQASTGPDEDLAALLDEAAPEVLARGDSSGAIAAMIRAADLSTTPAARARRLARAAWFGARLSGDAVVAQRLLAAAQRSDPTAAGALLAAAVLPYAVVDGRADLDTVHDVLRRLYAETDFATVPDEIHEVLLAHAMLATCANRADIWDSHGAAQRRLGARARVGDVLYSTFTRGAVAPRLGMLADLDAAIAALDDGDDLTHITMVGNAAARLDQSDAYRPALERALARYGGDDTNVLVIVVLAQLVRHTADRGDWAATDRAVGAARVRAGIDTLAGWVVELTAGLLAARRGRAAEVAGTLAGYAERSLSPVTRIVKVFRDLVQAEDALARAEWARAFALLRLVMPPDDPFGEFPLVPFLTLDLVEAAWRSGHVAEARAHVVVMEEAGCARLASRAALVLGGAQGVVAEDDVEAGVLFERALAGPGADRWPWEYARVQLAYGRRLGRGPDPRVARAPLAAALAGFERLGAVPWVEQAAGELRATGQGTARRDPPSSGLTAQERTIAELAARGLTNKEIGVELSLSPRTVSTHLYRIFPKLGVTSRAGLRDALAGAAGFPPERDEPS